MALLHRASITPSKQDVLDAWVPRQSWCAGTGGVHQVGSYRFDDPDDEVGLETFLVTLGGGPVLHVPLTYRPSPLVGAEQHLVATMEHSVLGRRWVYDACGDPVYAAALATTVLTGTVQAEQHVVVGGDQREPLELTTYVRGSGSAGADVPAGGPCVVTTDTEADTDTALTRIVSGDLDLVVVRRLGAQAPDGAATLTGTWPGVEDPAVLAWTA